MKPFRLYEFYSGCLQKYKCHRNGIKHDHATLDDAENAVQKAKDSKILHCQVVIVQYSKPYYAKIVKVVDHEDN